MNDTHKNKVSDAGATLVEFAIVVPLLLAMMGIATDVSFFFYRDSILNQAIHESVRTVVSNPDLEGAPCSSVLSQAQSLVFSTMTGKFDQSVIGGALLDLSASSVGALSAHSNPSLTIEANWSNECVSCQFLGFNNIRSRTESVLEFTCNL